jgi:hypothetical protein
MKLLLLFILLGGSAYTLSAQYLERTVTSSAGDHQSHPTLGSLHWTVGEIAVGEFQNGLVLSQGFQQGYIDVISGFDWETGSLWKVKVFPNPTTDWLKLETDLSGTLEVVLTNLLGRHLFTHTLSRTEETIHLQSLPSGIYLLRVSRKGQPIGTFRIQKVDD